MLSAAQGDVWSYTEDPLLRFGLGTELQVGFDMLQIGPKYFQGV